MHVLVYSIIITTNLHSVLLKPALDYSGFYNNGKLNPVTDTTTKKLIEWKGRTFIDTSWSSPFSPDSIFVYYYNVRSKYLESSEGLCHRASHFLEAGNNTNTGSGYITFRFFIDSAGQIQKRVQVIETSEVYKHYHFDENIVWLLFDYLESLKDWNPARAPKGYPPFYIGIMTFKIHEGKIVAVIP